MNGSVTAAILAYLLGSVPSGVLLGRWVRVDVRSRGSGNIGATNVARTAGLRLGLLTLAIDVAKGALAVQVARRMVTPPAELVAGLGVVLGHVFPIFLRFQGGKGVATALGVILVLEPAIAGLPLLLFVLVVATTRWVSLGSVTAAVSTPIAAALLGTPRPLTAVLTAIALLIVVRHRGNLTRLTAGEELRWGDTADVQDLPKK